MSELQQKTGYQKASITAQPLNGAVPKAAPLSAENWARGDLRDAFKTQLGMSVPGLKAAPRAEAASAENNAAGNSAFDGAAAAEARSARNDSQNNAQNNTQNTAPAAQAQDNAAPQPATPGTRTQDQAPAAATTHSPVPLQYAPTMLAGALSAQHKAEATKVAAPLDAYQDVFSIKSSNYNARRFQARIEEAVENNVHSNRDLEEQRLVEFAIEQERQMFMRSASYSAALNTVDETMRRQEQRLNVLHVERDKLTEKLRVQEQHVEDLTGKVETSEARVDKIEDTINTREEHKENAQQANAAMAEQEALDAKVKELPTIEMFKGEKGDYFTTTENGKKVTYLSTPDGDLKEVPEEDALRDTCNLPMSTYLKKNDDGSVSFMDQRGNELSQDKIDKLNSFMEKKEKTAADLADMDEFSKRKNIAREHEDKKLMPTLDKAVASESKLAKAMDDLNIPRDQVQNLEKYLADERKQLKDARKELEQAKADKSLTEKELAAKQAEIDVMEKEYKENKAFRERLTKGEFKDEKEMLKNMPAALKEEYNSNKKQAELAQAADKAPANAAPATATTATTNTSRLNGTAATAYLGEEKTSVITSDFKAAATATPAPVPEAPAPEAPAVDNMEYAVARQQPRSSALAMN